MPSVDVVRVQGSGFRVQVNNDRPFIAEPLAPLLNPEPQTLDS
jgi:hypothetical protein